MRAACSDTAVSTDRAGRDALCSAVIDRDRQSVVMLLERGHDPNVSDTAGWSPLHFAAQNCDAELVGLLLERGADHSTTDDHGNSPLFRAVYSSRGEGNCITALLEAGADPDQVNNHGVSPRALAESIANYDVRRFFA